MTRSAEYAHETVHVVCSTPAGRVGGARLPPEDMRLIVSDREPTQEAGTGAGTGALPATRAHVCTADCWADMLRSGPSPDCDPFAARAAAERDLPAYPDNWR